MNLRERPPSEGLHILGRRPGFQLLRTPIQPGTTLDTQSLKRKAKDELPYSHDRRRPHDATSPHRARKTEKAVDPELIGQITAEGKANALAEINASKQSQEKAAVDKKESRRIVRSIVTDALRTTPKPLADFSPALRRRRDCRASGRKRLRPEQGLGSHRVTIDPIRGRTRTEEEMQVRFYRQLERRILGKEREKKKRSTIGTISMNL